MATGWTVRGSNPGGGEIFRTCPDRPWGPPSLLYNGYQVFPRGKERPGLDADPSTLLVSWSIRVALYFYSPCRPYGLYIASVPVQGYTLPYLSACTWVTFTFFTFYGALSECLRKVSWEDYLNHREKKWQEVWENCMIMRFVMFELAGHLVTCLCRYGGLADIQVKTIGSPALEGFGWTAPRPILFISGKDPVPFWQKAVWLSGPVWTASKKFLHSWDSILGHSIP